MPNNFTDEDQEVQEEVPSQEFEDDGGIDVGGAGIEVEAVAEDFVENMTRESTDIANMSEAERRLDIAGYYRQLLRGSIFESNDPGACQVNAELAEFVEGRLQTLLGIRADHRPIAVLKPQFSDDEVASLRRFAAMSEVELTVFWALLATAARSKSVVGAPPVKAQPAPAKVVPVQKEMKPAPTMRRITAPNAVPAPAPPTRVGRSAATLAPRARPPSQQPGPAPVRQGPEAASSGPPKPLRMPRGKAMEGVMMHTAISQTSSGERIDEAYRSGRLGDTKVQR
jgi:hypothetical protein